MCEAAARPPETNALVSGRKRWARQKHIISYAKPQRQTDSISVDSQRPCVRLNCNVVQGVNTNYIFSHYNAASNNNTSRSGCVFASKIKRNNIEEKVFG